VGFELLNVMMVQVLRTAVAAGNGPAEPGTGPAGTRPAHLARPSCPAVPA